MNILIIEDDISLAKALQSQLMSINEVDVSNTAREGLHKSSFKPYDIFLIDLNLPDENGIQLCKSIRNNNLYTPILMLSGCAEVESKVNALEAGATDYIVKPFDIKELKARINAATRLIKSAPYIYANSDDLIIDPQSRTVIRYGQLITLRKKEFEILSYMARHANKVITRNMLIDHIWGPNTDPSSNMIDVHFNYLRNKIDKPFKNRLLHTVHGIGYVFKSNQQKEKGGDKNE